MPSTRMQPLLVRGRWNDSRTGATYRSSRVARGTPSKTISPPQTYNMRIFSSFQKKTSPEQHYTALVNSESTDPETWRARLAEQLPPLHVRSPFEQLIGDYLNGDKKPKLSLLVCECMKNRKLDVLAYVFAHEDIKRLHLQGPFDAQAWKTLTKAMPDSLPVTELKLSNVTLDASKCELLFNNVLSRMPALANLSLNDVTVKRSVLPESLSFPGLLPLERLEVSCYYNRKAGVYPLLRAILNASQVRHLSIEASAGAMSVRKHSKLANLLHDQTRLDSLQLKIKNREDADAFECYMEFLCGKTPAGLVELDLSGCFIQSSSFSKLIQALPSNQPALKVLSLSGCTRPDERTKKAKINNIDLAPLAEFEVLEHLDLSDNHLARGKIGILMVALREAGLPLVTLNVNGNQIGPQAISAMASLLRESATLQHLMFRSPATDADFGVPMEMLDLVEAVEHNKSLLKLEFRWTKPLEECHSSVDASLNRNKQRAYRETAMQAAASFAMPMVLNSPWPGEIVSPPQLPMDMIQHIIGQGLTERDALNLSSLDRATRASHEEFLRKAGS